MGIFDLPAVEERQSSKLFFLFGHIPDESSIKDPDCYIAYRLGRDARFVSFFSAIVVFTICLLHRYLGILPSLTQTVTQNDFLGLYLQYINFSGMIVLLLLPYYFLLFRRHVRFAEYNLFRNIPKIETYTDIPSGHKLSFPILAVGSLIFVVKPSAMTSLFYMEQFRGLFVQFFDSTLFVFLMSALIAFLHSIFAVLFSR